MPAPARFAAALAVLLLALPAQAEEAGIAGAVNLDVEGTPPGSGTSALTVGRSIVRDEHIVSNTQGLAQILFLDQTTLTVGPNSDIVIDEFVYDPASKDGRLLMEASVGVFRLIGGETATSGGINVATPFATLGIRGSNVVIEISPNGRTRVTCNYCETVEIQLLSDPDVLVTIFGDDRFRTIEIGPEGFSAPFQLTPEEIAQLQALLTSRPGQNGGVAVIPSEPQVSQAVTGADNSGKPAASNAPSAPGEVEQAYDDQLIPNPQEHTETGQNKNEEDAAGSPAGGTAQPFAFTGGGFLSIDYGGFSPFAAGDAGWGGDPYDPAHRQGIVAASLQGSQLVLTLSEGGTYTLPYQIGAFGFSDAGLEGEGFVAPNGTFFTYTVYEPDTGRLSFLHGGVALETENEAFQPIMAFELQPDLLGGEVPFLQSSMTATLAEGSVVQSPLYFVAYDEPGYAPHAGMLGVAALGVSGTGAGQSSLLSVTLLYSDSFFEGPPLPYVEGSTRAFGSQAGGGVYGYNGMETRFAYGELSALRDDAGGVFYGDEEGVYFVMSSGKWRGNPAAVLYEQTVLDGGESAQGYEPLHAVHPGSQPLPAGIGQDRGNLERTGYAAGVADLGNGRGYIGLIGYAGISFNSDGNTASLDLTTRIPEAAGFQSLSLGFNQGLYIDRSRIMMQEGDAFFDSDVYADFPLGALVSYALVPQPGDLLPGGAAACVCAFMEWGFWAYDLASGDRDSDYVATIPIGTWVTGEQILDGLELPEIGSASYSGHAIANILSTVDGVTAAYLASGAFSAAVDFGDRSMTGAVTGLDGRDYSFSNQYYDWYGANFGAQGSSSDGQVSIGLHGGFFRGPDSPVQGIAGTFEIEADSHSGLNYNGTGTFMGEQPQGQ